MVPGPKAQVDLKLFWPVFDPWACGAPGPSGCGWVGSWQTYPRAPHPMLGRLQEHLAPVLDCEKLSGGEGASPRAGAQSLGSQRVDFLSAGT